MPDADCLRLRAIRYLAMALKAREDGDADFARCLGQVNYRGKRPSWQTAPLLHPSLMGASTRHSVK